MNYYTIVFKHPLSNYCETDQDPVTTFSEAMEKAREKIDSFMLSAAGRLIISSEKIIPAEEIYEVEFSFTNGTPTGARVSIKMLSYSQGSNAIGNGALGLLGL